MISPVQNACIVSISFSFQGLDHRSTMEHCEIGWDRIGKRPEAKVWLYHIFEELLHPDQTSHIECIQYLYLGNDHRLN